MTRKKNVPVPHPSGTRFDYPPGDRHARCETCYQPRTPLFQTTPDTHPGIEQFGEPVPARVCLRCWSKHHTGAEDVCPHCGKDVTEEPLW
ncbi:hypothetical protein KQY30_18115 [Streptomyces sp. GMY02]|uniref:hypothetical protein n=1 Tax=Streptomyces sp. GMY02 TaxID=1333528 RepID=UPI001C2BE492|nr:hypothetical protein [Streptomyces sp. GMY02]QXE35891.1 hypothetical protein KQY30_18115 [Streptomyces sp. GMY02]